MPMSRRNFIRVVGSATVIAAAGAGTFVLTREPSKALEPWQLAGTPETDPRRKALSYAILAPNPHNRQPWMVDLVGDDGLVLYCDPERLLPVTDPFNRQITIGLGCFLELLRMAAAEDGHGTQITPFPEGHSNDRLDRRPVARVLFTGEGQADPLFAHTLARRSNKEPFDRARPVGSDQLKAISAAAGTRDGMAAHTTTAPDKVAQLRNLTWRGFVREMETHDAAMESVRLMRIGKSEIETNPDGIDLGGPMLEALNLLGLFTRETIADPGSTAYQQGLDMYREVMGSGMAYMWLTTNTNTRLDQLAAGAAYLRANLQATALGVDMHPLSQVLQEYEEMTPLLAETERLLEAPDAGRVQMLARLGYGPKVGPSPRWPAGTRLRTT